MILGLCLALSAQAQRISILGDSYSTFQGYIPEGNVTWYSDPLDTAKTDVANVCQTWWWQVIKDGGYLLEKNDSYSGSTVSYFGYRDADYSDRSFITRLPRLGSPDILLIFGCINDSWTGVKVGEYQYDHFTRADLFTYRPALAKLLSDALCRYPNVRICYIIGEGLRPEITESTTTICKHYGIEYVQLKDVDTKQGHPTIKGMQSIARQVLEMLQKQN
jgi:hypothetical protein